MARIPLEAQEFLRNYKQVIFADGRGRWMTLEALRKALFAGKGDDWHVVDIDLDTGKTTMECVYCATGVEHPSWPASGTSEASGTLH
jgi:hypothetical protein